jgi:hypothetical protein
VPQPTLCFPKVRPAGTNLAGPQPKPMPDQFLPPDSAEEKNMLRQFVKRITSDRSTSHADHVPRSEILAMILAGGWVAWIVYASSRSLPLPNIACPQDLGIMMDAGYRYYQGLRTHADYHSPLGPVIAMIFGIPMVIGGPSYSSMRYVPATVSAAIVAWTWCVCGYSLGSVGKAFTAVALGAIAGGIYHQGFPPEALSFATFYNRVGFGILGVITLAALLPRSRPHSLCDTFRDCSVAAGVLTLLFLKAVFAAVTLPFIAFSLCVHPRSRKTYIIVVAFSILVLLMYLGAIGFRVDRMWGDLLLAARARAQNGGVESVFFPIRNALSNIDFVSLAIVHVVLWWPQAWVVDARRSLAFGASVLICPTVVGWGMTLIQSHGDGRGISTLLCGLACSSAWIRHPSAIRFCNVLIRPEAMANNTICSLRSRVATTALVMAALLFIIPQAQSMMALRKVSLAAHGRQFDVIPLRELFVGQYANVLGPECVEKMNEGIDLIKRHCQDGASLQYMGGSNIYTFACGLRSPRDSMLFWCIHSSYSAAHHPPQADFADTEFVLVPKPSLLAVSTPEDWREAYPYLLSSEFLACEETRFFILYKRRPGDEPASAELP